MNAGGLLPLATTPVQTYLDSRVQLYHVIAGILAETGPAELLNTTFSVSEEFVRAIYRLRSAGLITRAVELADFKAAAKTVRINSFLHTVFDDVYLAENHSKVALLSNVGWKVSVITSQNQTRGNRLECGVITTDRTVFETLHCAIMRVLDGMAVPVPAVHYPLKEKTMTTSFRFAQPLGDYTEEDLVKVGEYAAALMKPSDIAVLLGADPDTLMADIANRRTEVSVRYFRAKAETSLLIHRKERELAKAGSAQAVDNLHRFESQMTIEENAL